MELKLSLPIGIEDFEEIRRDGYYYVDKTALIEQVLEKRSKVTLFTRPRRFGKSLNMSMLKNFFEIGTDVALFEGLHISKNTQLCEKYMGKYPVIAISLKSVDASMYEEAFDQLVDIINNSASEFLFLQNSDSLTDYEKERFLKLLDDQMNQKIMGSSMLWLTKLLEKHYNKKVVVLIDEYDVPLAKAYENGYYDKMVLLIRNMFGNVLKTNNSLAFAVLTGCLRIAKESIFTGLNNFKVYSITDEEFDETFGFTGEEVQKMLSYYGLSSCFDKVKEWYDGYRFGNTDVYCPWDVVNYCSDHQNRPNAEMKNYWMNTSGNEVISHFIDSINDPHMLTKSELELLVSGETVVKRVDEMITYKELYSNIDNLWSTLFMTGYLTQRGKEMDGRYHLAIPNREICNIIIERVLALFRSDVPKNGQLLNGFCNAMLEADSATVESNKFYQYCKSNAKQETSEEVSIENAFPFLEEGKHIISFVGAGGKSSLIDVMAKWGSNQGKKVLVTTTTHIFKPQSEILATNKKQLQKIWETGHWAVIGATEEKQPQKLKMPELVWMRQAIALADLVLIEADGSKRLPCKVPADHEPVLLPESDIVVAVLGLSALYHPLDECCFRIEQAKKLLSEDENHLLTEEDMATILLSKHGLRKNVEDRRYIAVLNQCDDDNTRKCAEQIGKILEKQIGQGKEILEKVVVTQLS